MFGQFGTVSPVHKDKTKSPNVWPIYKLLYLESYDSWIIPINVEYKSSGDGKARVIDTGYFLQIKLQQSNSLLTESSEPILHNGENDSHKRQFLALRVHSQSWILDNLSKKNSCQIDWCYKLLATIWQNFFLLSNVNCKVSNLKNKIADKWGQLALISKCQFDSGNII